MVFFTVVVGPAFFSDEMTRLLGRIYSGAAVQIVLERYFILQVWCLVIALVHLCAEWLYTGRPWHRVTLGLLIVFLGLNLAVSREVIPKMKHLHLVMYAVQSTPKEREEARKSFGIIHGTAQVLNLVLIAGGLYYLWQITRGNAPLRFGASAKFRG